VNVVGIHDGHNAAVALFQDGKIVYAVSEERILRVKNAGGFPINALQRMIQDFRLSPKDIDCVAFSGKRTPIPEWFVKDKILERYKQQCAYKDGGLSIGGKIKQVAKGLLINTYGKYLAQQESQSDVFNNDRIENVTSCGFTRDKLLFLDHHQCHAASAYYSDANYESDILCLTNDGGGDGLCATVSICKNGKIRRISETKQMHSISSLYARATFLMGMVPLEHEYKLMGLAPYSDQKSARNLANKILSRFDFTQEDGLTWETKPYFKPTNLWGQFLSELFFLNRFDVIAAAMQLFIEEITVNWVNNCIRKTGISRLVLSGGLFMNVKLNKLILSLPEVESVFIMPSCSDESNCFGAAHLGAISKGFDALNILPLKDLYLGIIYSTDCIKEALRNYQFSQDVTIEEPECIEDVVADLLSEGEIVAHYFGREEFGARALGNRSILADPSRIENIVRINKMIKQRDFWMPFAGTMTYDTAQKNLINLKNHFGPYMMMAFNATNRADEFPAATHQYDGTIRPQMLLKEWNPRYYKILKRFEVKTGRKGGLLNTSFNLHGYPIVSSPKDALIVFDRSGLQFVAIGSFLISKKRNVNSN
jgi:carbamoyltransferase